MKFHSLRTSLVGSALALIAAVLLGSCGGGGAESNNQGGNLLMLPQSGTFYAGMPATFSITGGRRPYTIISSQPGVLPVPTTVNGTSFTVIPNNPGVIDSSVGVGELPVRTVLIQATDSTGGFAQASIQVAQNFLTGYGITFSSNCVAVGAATESPQACAGGETALRIEANFNGNLIGQRTFRLEVMRGPFSWVFPTGQIAGNTITVTTDHEGKTFALFRVDALVPTQLAMFRIIDVETGASTEHVFLISGTPLAAELAIIPNEFTFTGPHTAACGTGSASFLVFDGVPPYNAISTSAAVTVTPASSSSQPGLFTFQVSDPNTCLTNATIVVTDQRLARGIVTITTEPGTADPPPPPLRAIPNTLTLTCGQSGSSVIAGGVAAATISATSNDPDLVVSVAARVVTITRNLDANNPVGQVNSIVTVTDGTSTTTITVRNPVTCT